MATPSRYYSYDQSQFVFFALHSVLKEFWANSMFPTTGFGGNPTGGLERLVYASNDYALRKRSEDLINRKEDVNSTQSQLDFPFLSYKRTGIEFNDVLNKWNHIAFSSGIYLDDIQDKAYITPVSITFEGIFWCSTESDLQWAEQQLRFIADGLTEDALEYSLMYGNTEVPMSAILNFNSINLDPTYNENDWLTQNKIHTINLDFQIDTYMVRFGNPLKPNANWSLTEKVIFDFKTEFQLSDDTLDEEVIELLYSELAP